MDSVRVYLTHPNGSGSTTTRSASIDEGGYFSLDNIPIGNHDLDIVYIPDNDTLSRFVTILPNSQPHFEYYLDNDVW